MTLRSLLKQEYKPMEEKIKLYCIQAAKLRSYPEFQKSFGATLNWDQEKGLALSHHGPDEKTITAVFMAVRPFLMKERINFEELCKDILASDYDEAIKQDTQEVFECVEHTHASRKGQAAHSDQRARN